MREQTLLEAVRARFTVWPAPGSGLYFNCDIDGEVRTRNYDDAVCFDFYPLIPVRVEDRRTRYGESKIGETIITEEIFNAK